MGCYHPLKGWQVGLTLNGKPNYKITSYDIDHLEQSQFNGQWLEIKEPIILFPGARKIREFIEVPCGRCIGCRLAYSRDWANRCLLELEQHNSSYFVTLTYNDAHLRYSQDKDGNPSATLYKRDIQLFFKRLRKRFPDQRIRYFGCGEYGPTTFRPHYHLIIFGLELDDLKLYKRIDRGVSFTYNYYTSDTLARCWSEASKDKGSVTPLAYEPIGYVVVGQVTWETCAYTARYMTKKLLGDEAIFYDTFGLTPPFSLCSRRPGIAGDYYHDHPEWKDHAFINVRTEKGGRKVVPPRYFHRLFDIDDPEASSKAKEMRKALGEIVRSGQLEATDLDYLSYLCVSEENQVQRIKSLKRSEF